MELHQINLPQVLLLVMPLESDMMIAVYLEKYYQGQLKIMAQCLKA